MRHRDRPAVSLPGGGGPSPRVRRSSSTDVIVSRPPTDAGRLRVPVRRDRAGPPAFHDTAADVHAVTEAPAIASRTP
jgi:hypothetical protein